MHQNMAFHLTEVNEPAVGAAGSEPRISEHMPITDHDCVVLAVVAASGRFLQLCGKHDFDILPPPLFGV